MDFRDLEVFIAVGKLQSFSRAAAHLRCAQSALSRRVQRLEHLFGTPLLERHGRGVRLTETGLILLGKGEALRDQLRDIRVEMNAVSVEPAGTICMALPHGIGRILAPRIVEAYQQRCPKVKLNLVEVAGRAEDAAVSRVDLCIVYNLRQSSEFVAKPLLSERLVVIAPRRTMAGELIPYPDSYRCADLAKLKLILPSHNHGLRLNIDQAFASQNIEVEPVLEVDGFSILKRLVESGSGYTIMTASPAYFELASGALAAIPIVSPSLSLELQLVYRRDKTVSRALSELIAVTEQQMAIFAGTNGHFSARPRRQSKALKAAG